MMTILFPENKDTQNVYFTKDRHKTEISCGEGSYILILMTLRVYGYQAGSDPVFYDKEFKMSPFKGRLSVVLGELVDPYFHLPDTLQEIFHFSQLSERENLIPLFRPLEADLVFKEVDSFTQEVKGTHSVSNFCFLPGKFSDLLNFSSPAAGRVGEVFSISGLYENESTQDLTLSRYDKAYVPGQGIPSVSLEFPEKVLSCFIWMIKNQKEGSQFLLEYSRANPEYLRRWQMIPKGLQSCYVLWLDENLALRVMEFTGRYKIRPVHALIGTSYMRDGIEISRTIEDVSGREMVLNTGFIFKDDIKLIESVIASRKAWVTFDFFRTFTSFYPKTGELPEYDSEQQLYYFDLEVVLNKEDVEDHSYDDSDSDEDSQYQLIFSAHPGAGTSLDLSGCLDQPILEVDWGDGSKDTASSHTYSQSAVYVVRVKIDSPVSVNLKNKNITSFQKIPASVSQINCMGCQLSADAVENLFKLVYAHFPGDAEITYDENVYNSFFTRYILAGNQQTPVVMTAGGISEAAKLIEKYWFVDYAYKIDFSQPILGGRYLDPANYGKYCPKQYELNLTAEKSCFFDDETIILSMTLFKGSGVPWALYDFQNFLYPRLDIFENNKWKLKKRGSYHVPSDEPIQFNIGKLSKGLGYKVRGVNQKPPSKMGNDPEFSIIQFAELELDVIAQKSVYVLYNPAFASENVIRQTVNKGWFNFFPFGFVNHSGLGTPLGYSDLGSGYTTTGLTAASLKNYSIFQTTEAGNYRFSFKNYRVNMSALAGSLTGITFYLAYVSPSNNIQMSNPFYVNMDGLVVMNGDYVIENIPSGSWICPFGTAEVLAGVTHIDSKWYVENPSKLVIEKV